MLRIIKLKRLILLSIIFTITSAQSASALFGSECRAPKSSYSNYQKQALSYKAQSEKAAVQIAEKLKKDLIACKADYKSFAYATNRTNLIKNKSNCGYLPLLDEYLYIPGTIEKNTATKNSYQVVVNNQKCFSPELVIEAQRALNLIK